MAEDSIGMTELTYRRWIQLGSSPKVGTLSLEVVSVGGELPLASMKHELSINQALDLAQAIEMPA